MAGCFLYIRKLHKLIIDGIISLTHLTNTIWEDNVEGFVLYITLGVAFILFLDHVFITPGHNEQRERCGNTPEARAPRGSLYTNLTTMSDRTCLILYCGIFAVALWMIENFSTHS